MIFWKKLCDYNDSSLEYDSDGELIRTKFSSGSDSGDSYRFVLMLPKMQVNGFKKSYQMIIFY